MVKLWCHCYRDVCNPCRGGVTYRWTLVIKFEYVVCFYNCAMNLPADIVNLFVVADPVVWLGVSKTARKAALIAIRVAITRAPGWAGDGGAVIYKNKWFRVSDEHGCSMYDVFGPSGPICDICVSEYVQCSRCNIFAEPPPVAWLTNARSPQAHYCVVVLVIIESARGRRLLPYGFGTEI